MMRERISLEDDIEQTTKLIKKLSVKEPDPQPEGWRDELEEVRRARTTSGTIHLASQEQKEETIPEGRRILRPARLMMRQQPEGWRDELEEVRRARTTSGTVHHTSQEQKEETIPDGKKTVKRGGMSVNLNVPNSNIINIGSSRSPVKEIITNFENIHLEGKDIHKTSTLLLKTETGNVKKLAETFSETSRNESSSSQHPAMRNIKLNGKQSQKKPVIPEEAKKKPPSSKRIWTKLKSGLFGWKNISSVSVPTKPSHGKTTSKISTHFRSENFEVKSVTKKSYNIPPKISLGGRESSTNQLKILENNKPGEGLHLLAGKSSFELEAKRSNGGR